MQARFAPHIDAGPVGRAVSQFVLALAMGALVSSMGGCAHRVGAGATVPQNPPVTQYEMEPIKITAVSGAEGTHIEAYDAAELFEQGGKALSEKRYDDAIVAYDRVLNEFKESRFTRAALYNAGLAYQGKKDWEGAIVRFKVLADSYADSGDAKDAVFQLGATYAELKNWPASIQVFAQALERKDLTADDRLEALSRRGFAQFQLKDLDTAERTFRSAVGFFHQIEAQERLETDFYLALAMYHLGEISHERFRAVPLRLPVTQMQADLEQKAHFLLTSRQQYIDTLKLGNAGWASAAGYQIASLFEELYDAFIHAPVPPELLKADAHDELAVYYEEVRKKIRVLLEKSVRTHEANLLMMERLGVKNEWRDKSKLAYAKIQQLLDPSFRAEFAPGGVRGDTSAAAAPGGGPASIGADAPAIPEPPPSRGSAPDPAVPPANRDEDRGTKPRPNERPIRQIL